MNAVSMPCLRAIGLALAMALPFAAACESVPRTPEERVSFARKRLQQGTRDIERGRLDDATGKLREAVKYDPELAEAHRYLGKLLFHKGEHHDRNSDKLEQEARASEARGDMVAAGQSRRDAQNERREAAGYFAEALRSLEIYDERERGNPEVSYMIGFVYLTRDEYELAMQSFAAGYRSEEASPKWKRKFEEALKLCQDRLAGTRN